MIEDLLQLRENRLAATLLRSVQNKLDWPARDALGRTLAEVATEAQELAPPRADAALLEQLEAAGICNAPRQASADECAQVVAHFRATPCFGAHVPAYSDGVARLPAETAPMSSYGSYRLRDSIAAPHLIEFALDPAIVALAAGYLRCLPSLYSINTFWTFPSEKPGLSHAFHRDEDDYRFMVVFVYWTDVDVGEGELYFIDGTHDYHAVARRVRKPRWLKRHLPFMPPEHATTAEEFRRLNGGNGYGFDAYYQRLFGDQIRCVSGRAGTAIAADTFALHRGTPPRSRPRLVTWFRYGLYENAAYKADRTEPVPASLVKGRLGDDPATRYVSRLLLDWNA